MSRSSFSGCWAILVFLDSGFCSGHWLIWYNEGIKPPFNWQQGSLFIWVGVLCIRGRKCQLIPPPDTEGYLPVIPSMFGLANHDPVLWVVVSFLGFTIQWHLQAVTSFPWPNVHVPSDVYTQIFTSHYLGSSPIFSGCSGGSMIEVITSH